MMTAIPGASLAASIIAIALLHPCTTIAQVTSADDRMAAWHDHVRLEQESLFRDLTWRAVGPQMQGGRIESIAVPAGENSTIYVGVGSGNLWKTVNNGTTWKAIFEKESAFTIGDVAVAKSDPDIVWVGTGEVLMARSSYAGTGVFKSEDAGRTWRHTGLTDTHHNGQVLIHPSDPKTVYVAAIGHLYSFNEERGLFRTRDGDETWEKVLYVNDRTGVMDLVMDPSDPLVLYATTWERTRKAWGYTASGAGSGIFETPRLHAGIPHSTRRALYCEHYEVLQSLQRRLAEAGSG